EGKKPEPVKDLIVLRTEKDKRSAWIKWRPAEDAYAYNLYYGTAPDKLYNSIMVYNTNEYWFKVMDSKKTYYFAIEALNENGVSPRTRILQVN
ncbi:MAG TPA: fibronectin type III domain-containing protein, partial [Puia sp.]|nr:fibronectin type III domain-containing protein [Puia sp.]